MLMQQSHACRYHKIDEDMKFSVASYFSGQENQSASSCPVIVTATCQYSVIRT